MAPSCVKEDFDTVPSNPPSLLEANTTIKQLRYYYDSSTTVAFKKIKDIYPQYFYNKLKASGLDTTLIIKATVVSSDSAGNIYKSVWIDDGTGGIEVPIDAKSIYSTYGLKPGQPIVMKISDLCVKRFSYDNVTATGDIQIGVLDESGLGRIPGDIISKYIELSGARVAVTPITVKMSELNSSMVGRFVRIDGVEFVSVDTSKNYIDGTAATNRTLKDCDGNNLTLRTSGYALFGAQPLPNKNGSIVGIFNIFNKVKQITIRSEKDVEFVNDRCVVNGVPVPNTTLAELRAMYTGSTYMQITTPVVVEATVIANDASGNLYKQVFLQDATGGMELKINRKAMSADYPVGQKVIINCEGLFLGSYGGVIQLGGTFEGTSGTAFGGIEAGVEAIKVVKVSGGTIIAPTITTISALSDANLMKLIQLDDVQFADSELGLAYAPSSTTNRTLRDCGGATVVVRTSNFANFAKTVVPDKKGTFVGVLGKFNGTYQLILREAADANFTQPRCQ